MQNFDKVQSTYLYILKKENYWCKLNSSVIKYLITFTVSSVRPKISLFTS